MFVFDRVTNVIADTERETEGGAVVQTFNVAIVNPSIISLLTHVSSLAVSSAASNASSSITLHSDSLLQNLFAAIRYVVDTTRTCFESMGRVISSLTFSTR